MILDLLTNAPMYTRLHPLFEAAFNYLHSFDQNTPDGKYEIMGTDLIAIVERYATKTSPEKEWEAHEVYGDIQVVMQGQEKCGHAERSNLSVSKPYNRDKDVEKYSAPSVDSSALILKPGMFAIFYPHDAHQPSVKIHAPESVLKVVLKFRLKPAPVEP